MKKFILLVIGSLVVSSLSAKEITIGRTWDIVEPDPIVEAQKRANAVSPEKMKPKSSFRSRFAAKGLFRTITPKTREYTPIHTLEREVVDKNGGVLYPTGYKFNPIKYMRQYTNRIIIIDQDDAPIIKKDLKPSDIVIVNNGDLKETSVVLNRKITMLDILTAESMDIRRIPVVVTVNYEKHFYKLEEFLPEQGLPL